MSRFFLTKPAVMSAVIVDGAVHVEFRSKDMLSRVEKDVCLYLGQQKFFQHFGRLAQ